MEEMICMGGERCYNSSPPRMRVDKRHSRMVGKRITDEYEIIHREIHKKKNVRRINVCSRSKIR